MINHIPQATYRLQLRSDFGFRELGPLAPYFEQLGISDLYLSPLFRARKDSSHGYDVVDHSVIEPEFGSLELFQSLALEVRQRHMGILLDVVPNHMGINDPANKWWQDVLENGPLSRYAANFDIDWERSTESLHRRILLPVLGDHFGRELEQGKLSVEFHAGRFFVRYCSNRYPLAPDTWPSLVRSAAESIDGASASALHKLADKLESLPSRHTVSDAAIEQRYRVQDEAVAELTQVSKTTPAVRRALDQVLVELNGTCDDPRSFDNLEELLSRQWYRLAYWRAAADEINYRRFFDINDLAAIRVELPEVFDAAHELAKRLLQHKLITGLRIDHPDGLLNPMDYFASLQRMYRTLSEEDQQLYVVVEKILTGEETLPNTWPVAGTTGYELLNDLNCLLADGPGLAKLQDEFGVFCEVSKSAPQVVYESKKQILDESMSSEFHTLAGRLHRLAQRQRMARDFTFPALLKALREVIACFPVYRTYVPPHGWDVNEVDYGRVMTAVRWAKLRNPTMDWGALDFIGRVLVLEFPQADNSDREQFREFVLRFQQITGPVTAKGIEDTAFYRYYPCAALNEVGGELPGSILTAEDFHRRMQHRFQDWPHGLSATATHDTKRGEDTRARLLVLTEADDEWTSSVYNWRQLNQSIFRSLRDVRVPSPGEEYLIYQTLVGTWPGEFSNDEDREVYAQRIVTYCEKALREAKVNTSWSSPVADYEEAVSGYIRDLIDRQISNRFLSSLGDFVGRIATAGYINSLSQLVLKATVPGVPDFYQGCELWDFNLVDPDNRRPVDYERRVNDLGGLVEKFSSDSAQLIQQLRQSWPDPSVKLFITWRLLQVRSQCAQLFAQGEYVPLTLTGEMSHHLIAFARRYEGQYTVTIAPLHVYKLTQPSADQGMPIIKWDDSTVELPDDAPRQWVNWITQEDISLGDDLRFNVRQLLGLLPIAVLKADLS